MPHQTALYLSFSVEFCSLHRSSVLLVSHDVFTFLVGVVMKLNTKSEVSWWIWTPRPTNKTVFMLVEKYSRITFNRWGRTLTQGRAYSSTIIVWMDVVLLKSTNIQVFQTHYPIIIFLPWNVMYFPPYFYITRHLSSWGEWPHHHSLIPSIISLIFPYYSYIIKKKYSYS